MNLNTPTDRIVFGTLVNLLRQVPWGASRDQLEQQASSLLRDGEAQGNKSYAIELPGLGQLEAFNAAWEEKRACLGRAAELFWRSELFSLAAQARFPREGDRIVANFTERLVEDIREFKNTGFTKKSAAMRGVSEAVFLCLRENGLELSDLPLPPTLQELIDTGAARPEHVSEERWNSEVEAYNHRMTLDNTPDEFIYGDRDDYYADDYCGDDEVEYHDEEIPEGIDIQMVP
jgi:hypothetical protein